MYKVTTIFEKSNPETQYFLAVNPSVRQEFSTFSTEEPELLLLNVVDESSTKQISEAFYADESSFNLFMQKFNQRFPTFFVDRDAYHQSVGITTTRTAGEI